MALIEELKPILETWKFIFDIILQVPMAAKGKESENKEEERSKEKGRIRNIDHFMEELKHEQELRERRNQEREHWRGGRPAESSAPSTRFDELPDDFDPSGKLPGSFDDF